MSLLTGPPDSTGDCQSALVDELGVSPTYNNYFCLFLAAVCIYIRYLEIKSFQQMVIPRPGVSNKFNKVTSVFGLLSCIGLDIVANFQESNVIVVHMLGAVLCFSAGTIYFTLQVSSLDIFYMNLTNYLSC
jgi:hypothetical protein